MFKIIAGAIGLPIAGLPGCAATTPESPANLKAIAQS